MGFEPLSEAPLRALSVQARFLVVLAEAESLSWLSTAGVANQSIAIDWSIARLIWVDHSAFEYHIHI